MRTRSRFCERDHRERVLTRPSRVPPIAYLIMKVSKLGWWRATVIEH